MQNVLKYYVYDK